MGQAGVVQKLFWRCLLSVLVYIFLFSCQRSFFLPKFCYKTLTLDPGQGGESMTRHTRIICWQKSMAFADVTHSASWVWVCCCCGTWTELYVDCGLDKICVVSIGQTFEPSFISGTFEPRIFTTCVKSYPNTVSTVMVASSCNGLLESGAIFSIKDVLNVHTFGHAWLCFRGFQFTVNWWI